MCGIVAIYAFHPAAGEVDPEELVQIRDRMTRRGPDAEGLWLSGDRRVGMGHRRLSIIDLSQAGDQPMSTGDGSLRIVFNGEIYNYRRLRQELMGKGYRFQSNGDTEVILRLYEEKGAALVDDLRGMFAFALWDDSRRSLLLARDPYGIKPLYYTRERGIVRVASQVKALAAGGKISRDLDPAGVVGFHLWGSVPEPYTLYSEVRALPAGATMLVTEQGLQSPRQYWSPAQVYGSQQPGHASEEEVDERIRRAIKDSIEDHLEADVPVGVFLSAGIDSSLMTAMVKELDRGPVRTVTLAFEEYRGTPADESVLAEETARHYGTDHSTVFISQADFEQALPDLLESMDQPSVDGVNTYFVARAAAQLGLKVAISGLGGDELFGGYSSFLNVPWATRLLFAPSRVPLLGGAFRHLSGKLSRLSQKPKWRSLLEYGGSYPGAYFLQRGLLMPWELDQWIDPDLIRARLEAYDPLRDAGANLPAQGSPFDMVATLEQCRFMRNQLLRDSDWAGMAHSLEIRVPLVDRSLCEQIGPLIGRFFTPEFPKARLARCARPVLPAGVLSHSKKGFFVPMAEWIKEFVPLRHPGEHWSRAWARHCVTTAMGDLQ